MHTSKRRIRKKTFKGCGLVSSALKGVGSALNKGIDLLPIELHVPSGLTSSYNWCGPGTRIKERLARGDQGINKLDEACKIHDLAYAQYSDTEHRAQADRDLAERAWQRFKASDSSIGEKATAWAVTTAMKAKAKLGGSHKRKARKQKKGKGLYLRPWPVGKGVKKTTVKRKKRCACKKKKTSK